MGHKLFALTSCVAAFPAAVLIYFLVTYGFLQHADKMNVKMLGMVGLTLFISFFVMVTPFGILIFGGPRKKKAAAPAPVPDKAAAAMVLDGDSSEADVAEFDSSGEANVFDSSESSSVFDSSGAAAILESSGEAAVFDSDTDMAGGSSEFKLDATTAFATPAAGSDIDFSDSDALGSGDLSDFEEIEDEVILEDDDEDEPPARKKKR